MDSMIPLLTGWLAAATREDGPKAMKIAGIDLADYRGFTVTFQSGLRLRVSVEEVPAAKEAE